MRRYRLFCPSLSDGRVTLSPEESQHLIRSLRAKPGQAVSLFDGEGAEADGVIARIDGHLVEVEVEGITHRPFELARRITLAVAMGKANRQGYLVEKCTELGVAAIWPLIADRSVTRPDAAAVGKWSRRAVEAAKQSGRSWVPRVANVRPFADVLEKVNDFDVSAWTHVADGAPPLAALLTRCAPGASVLVWVGPEGGWSHAECEQAAAAGTTKATLGPMTLRTETAAVAVCAIASMVTAQMNAGD